MNAGPSSPPTSAPPPDTAEARTPLATLRRLVAEAPASLVATHVSELLGIEPRLQRQLEHELSDWLDGFPPLPRRAAASLIDAGGKRVRPLLAFLSAAAVEGDAAAALPVAIAVELLHTGTLLHDDVIDEGDTRRGQPSARARYGNPLAILSGDFCFFAAVEVLTHLEDYPLMRASMDVARALAAGELMQLERRGRIDAANRDVYEAVIERKTGALFGFAAWGGARLGGGPPAQQEALGAFGRSLGASFQILDDILDIEGEAETVGKQLGIDLARGVVTLPLLYAYDERPELLDEARRLVEGVGAGASSEEIHASERALIEAIAQTEALERAKCDARAATERALTALASLPKSRARQSLRTLATLLSSRIA